MRSRVAVAPFDGHRGGTLMLARLGRGEARLGEQRVERRGQLAELGLCPVQRLALLAALDFQRRGLGRGPLRQQGPRLAEVVTVGRGWRERRNAVAHGIEVAPRLAQPLVGLLRGEAGLAVRFARRTKRRRRLRQLLATRLDGLELQAQLVGRLSADSMPSTSDTRDAICSCCALAVTSLRSTSRSSRSALLRATSVLPWLSSARASICFAAAIAGLSGCAGTTLTVCSHTGHA
jgi:hypothetical protein